jgi:hypothetical protein
VLHVYRNYSSFNRYFSLACVLIHEGRTVHIDKEVELKERKTEKGAMEHNGTLRTF